MHCGFSISASTAGAGGAEQCRPKVIAQQLRGGEPARSVELSERTARFGGIITYGGAAPRDRAPFDLWQKGNGVALG